MHIQPLPTSSPAGRRKTHRCALFAAIVLAMVWSAHACADERLPPIGGGGGGGFDARCPANQLLVGFELRAADDVDAIRPLCVTAYGPRDIGAPSAGAWHGGGGGGPARVACPMHAPVVTGMFVAWEGVDTFIVNNIHLFCGEAATQQARGDVPAAVFDAPAYRSSGFYSRYSGVGEDTQHCAGGQVAVGVHGRSGIWLDAIGLICAAPRLTVKSIGRVDTGTPSSPRPPGWTICDSARDARARNSPAAPNLEAQCLASKTTVKSIGRVGTPAQPRPAGSTICDAARAARARNSPAAPNLEAQCRATGGP